MSDTVRTATVRIAADHPAFAGHFPGRPVLPGVSLLAEVLEVVRADPAFAEAVGSAPTLAVAKFAAAVGPASAIDIRVQASPAGVDFTVHDGDGRLAASGRFARAPTA